MRLIIASDIHGDADCCRELLETAEKERADKILLLGDLLYHGPRNNIPAGYAPARVIEMLNLVSDKLLCVRGNCESEVDQMVLDFPIMSDTAYFYDGDAKKYLFMSHGHKYSPEKLPKLPRGAIFLSGHTHILSISEIDGIVCLNPGSVSLPKGNNPRSFATYENGVIEIKDFGGKVIASRKV